MTDAISAAEFRLLRDLIERLCGIALGEEKAYLIETRLAGLLVEHGCQDFGAFYRLVASDPNPQLKERIVDAMTTNETLWFRDGHPFVILKEKLLPALAARLRDGSRFRVRLWSAACSTGQEPYSLAMSVLEFCRLNPGVRPEQFEILATDISPSALFMAKAGRYDQAAVNRGLPDALRDRYFRPEGHVWVAGDDLKRLITFRKFNLLEPLEPLGAFDIVFMRYVAIYFSDAFKQRIYGNVANLLAPSGHLLISAVESLRGISDAFVQLGHANGAYYERIPS
jgi:chemotaxis protein methyltransferase CheR